jgi:hypothetical protein
MNLASALIETELLYLPEQRTAAKEALVNAYHERPADSDWTVANAMDFVAKLKTAVCAPPAMDTCLNKARSIIPPEAHGLHVALDMMEFLDKKKAAAAAPVAPETHRVSPGVRDARGWIVHPGLQDGVGATADRHKGPRFMDVRLDADGLEVDCDPECLGTVPLDVLLALLDRVGYDVTKRGGR